MDCRTIPQAMHVRAKLQKMIDDLQTENKLERGPFNFCRVVERKFGELYFEVRTPSGGRYPKLPKHIQNKPQGPDPKAQIAPSIRDLIDCFKKKNIDCAS